MDLSMFAVLFSVIFFFFFNQKTAYELLISDWSSDVCSSDLIAAFLLFGEAASGSKLGGIVVALIALACLLFRPRPQEGSGETGKTIALLLAGWVGYGTIDCLFKQMDKSGSVISYNLSDNFNMSGLLHLLLLYVTTNSSNTDNAVI